MNDIIEKIKAGMLPVEGGRFQMGDRYNTYRPILKPSIGTVEVVLSDFHISNHTVTCEEWEAVMNKSNANNSKLPKVNVTWHEVQDFILELNHLTHGQYRLPTEAEWEYTARGGQYDKDFLFSGKSILDHVGWYEKNSKNSIKEVQMKEPNLLGLFDMSGNVWEWCQDIYSPKYPKNPRKGLFSSERVPISNPQGALTGNSRVIRGGSFSNSDYKCWVFYRNKISSTSSFNNVGFRLVY
jgi:sulfatase modifying factor 1